jgi:hypothetical protein
MANRAWKVFSPLNSASNINPTFIILQVGKGGLPPLPRKKGQKNLATEFRSTLGGLLLTKRCSPRGSITKLFCFC